MLLSGEPRVKILFMIIRQYRLILRAKLLNDSGYSISTIIKKTGWHPYVAKKVLKQSKYFSEKELIYILNKLLEIDIELKTSAGTSEQILETSLLKLIKK
jgi:DNA polymerase-3 subunit delta